VPGPDWKPAKRIEDPDATRRVCVAEGKCRLCGKRARPYFWKGKHYAGGLTGHHLVSRSQRGDDVDDNIVPLCGHGTVGCHGDVEHHKWARVALRAMLTEANEEYCVRKKGWVWLEKRYPRRMDGPLTPATPRHAEIDRSGWPPYNL
jgi:hypothetical protein